MKLKDTVYIGGGQIWTSGNDGASSGLDADTLDGVQGGSYLRSDADDTYTGTLSITGTIALGELRIGTHGLHNGYTGLWNTEASTTTTGQYLIISAGTDTYINGDSVFIRGGNNSNSNELKVTTGGSYIGGNLVLHAGNISSYALTSLPSHNHDDRYFTETESDSRYLKLAGGTMTGTLTAPTIVPTLFHYAYGWRKYFKVRSVGVSGGSINNKWVHLFSVEIGGSYDKALIKAKINGYDDVSIGTEVIQALYENGGSTQENHDMYWYSIDNTASLFKTVKSIRTSASGLRNTYEVWVQMAGDWRDTFTMEVEFWEEENRALAFGTANGQDAEPSGDANDITKTSRQWAVNSNLYIGGNITLAGTVDGRDIAADGTKLDGIASGANNYSLPVATASVLGGIKIGTNLSIDANGVVSSTDTNTWRPLGTGATDAAAGNHNHDGTYQKQVDEVVVDITRPDASSGTWNTADSDDWGTPRIGTIAARYNDGTGYLQFNIPSGMETAYISQLTWSSGGYADIYGIQADGGAVFLRRINTRQSIENSNEGSGGGNPNQHDGTTVTLLGTGLSTFSAIRIQNRSGRIHVTGMSFSSNKLIGAEGTGLVHPAQMSTTSGLNADTLDGLHASSFLQSLPSHTHDDRYYTETEVDTLLATKQAAGSYLGATAKAADSEKLDGADSTQIGNRNYTQYGFTVGGEANTYYPVVISGTATYAFNRYSITRRYADTAPWDPIGTGVHHGGLTFDFYWSGDTAWGGNDKTLRVHQFSEQYTTMVAGLALARTGGVVVWLRGGTAYYKLQVDGARPSVTVYLETFVDGAGTRFDPRTNLNSVSGEIYGRMPVRGSNELYDSNTRVSVQGHTHDDRYYTESEVDTKLATKAASSHTHAIADVTGLQTALDGKAASSHTHNYVATQGNYVWRNDTLAGSYTTGIQTSFVRSSDGFPDYGAVLHVGARGGNDAGGDFQIYSGHGSANGGNYLRVRNADNNADPSDSWTSWRTIWDSGNFDPDSKAAAAHTHDDRYYTESEVNTLLAGKLSTTGKAADAETVDGIDSSRIVYGANERRSTRYDGEGIVSRNQNSGFYYGYDPDGGPYTEWWNWLTVAGASWTSNNNYDFKLAHNFHADDLYVSRMTNGTQYSWRKIIDSANIGSYALTSLPSHTHDDRYYTESETDTLLATKQAAGSYAAASHTHGIGAITDATRWWNNFGDNHTTRTRFDAQGGALTTGFGWRFVQGATNGPGVGNTGNGQYYSLTVGLGNDYDYNLYGMQIAIPRTSTTPYLSVRFEENRVLGAWQKISAGYADSAGAVAWGNVSGKPSTFAPSSHNHDDRYYTETEVNNLLNAKGAPIPVTENRNSVGNLASVDVDIDVGTMTFTTTGGNSYSVPLNRG